MSELRINPEKVSHIRIHGLQETNYFYRPETIRKYFFGLFKEVEREGYYITGGLEDIYGMNFL